VSWYRNAVYGMAILLAAIGVALLVRTAAEGGGVLGFVLGGLFLALGIARFTLERKRHAIAPRRKDE
jgi:hypothetical protein